MDTSMKSESEQRSLTLPIGLKNRKQYLRTLAGRLIYLHTKQQTLPEDVKYPSYLIEEINAMFWLLAQYEYHSSCDVAAVLREVDVSGIVNIARYSRFLESVATIEWLKKEEGTLPTGLNRSPATPDARTSVTGTPSDEI